MSLATPRKGYKEEKLKNLCKFSSGEFLPVTQQQKGNIPVFGGNGINGFHNKSITKNPTIIIGRVGAYCGSIHISKEQCWVTDNAIFINSLNEEINIDFLFRYLLKININRLAETAAQPKISQSILRNIVILYPNLKEQQKIATILSNVDNLIESTVQVITNSKKVKTGLMQKLLTRGIGHTKFKKVTMGLRYMLETYPEEWIISTLEENAELQRGKFGHRPRDDPDFYGGEYPFIQTGDVEKSNKYILTYSQTLNEKGLKVSKIFPKGIIVITIAANIGSTSITTFDTCFPDSLIGISTNSMNIEFLEYFMTTRKNYLNAVATTSAQKNINYETLNPLKIPIPPLPEQQKIASILSNIDSKITSQEQYKEKLERLKKSLMQKLLTGEVRV